MGGLSLTELRALDARELATVRDVLNERRAGGRAPRKPGDIEFNS